ncbi:MAG: toll/interleukin-1 receptor domain-containing protein [Proteobacteria bacterium]|nr:toll/interleukin-1 receptor domain-containing protein [Pseudomonadota bacterium]
MNNNYIKAFVSYAHTDYLYFDLLLNGIKRHSKQFRIDWDIWEDTRIPIGSQWDELIKNRVISCNLAILLISSNFLYSEYIDQNELSIFIERSKNDKDLVVFPILIDPCFYRNAEFLSKIQLFSTTGSRYGKPTISDMTYADLVIFNTEGVVMPNPMRERFHMDVVSKIQSLIKEKHIID